MQFESWEDAVKKAKAKAVEEPLVVPDSDPAPSVVRSARLGLIWKASAIALCLLVVFGLGFLVSRIFTIGPGVQVGAGDPGATVRSVSAPFYRIIGFDGDLANPLRKDVYFVRLREKVTKDVLAGLADELRRKGPPEKERIIIWFYLPQVDAFKEGGPFGAPWALADFNPRLKLDVYGLNAEQEAELASSPIPPGRDVVGRWIEDCNGGEGLYTIFHKDGSLYLETMGGRPSEGLIVELREAGPPSGQRFERKEFSRAGDYYLINHNRDLEVRDNGGLISVCKKVE